MSIGGARAVSSICLGFTLLGLTGCFGKAGLDGQDDSDGACNPERYDDVSLDSVADEFAANVYPLIKRTANEGGCITCHGPSSGRLFRVTDDPIESFYLARAEGFFKDQPGSMLDRLLTSDPMASMPKEGQKWAFGELRGLSKVSCKVRGYELTHTTPPDEEFPPYLLRPYAGAPHTGYDNTFINFSQLKGRVKAVFGDDWVRDGANQFDARISLFGGVDFKTRFIESRTASAEFLLGLDALAPAVCGRAVTQKAGPFAGMDPPAALGDDAATRSKAQTVFGRMLYRSASPAELEKAQRLVTEVAALSSSPADGWGALCEALIRHPDFLFTRAPAAETASPEDRARLQLVKLAQDLVARPPTAAELQALTSGASSYAALVDAYLNSPEFTSYYFERMRIRTEADGSPEGDEPARLWTHLVRSGKPYTELFTGDYSVDAAFGQVGRPAYHGRTGVLTMKGFIKNKPGLPHYNYSARVFTDYLGAIFEVPPEVFEQRGAATATSTVDSSSLCYSCHQNLTPLAHQRLRWTDDGAYRETDDKGAPLDDSDRGMVASYAFKGRGMEAFAVNAARKEAFTRRTLNAQYAIFFGRAMRHADDERDVYKTLWDAAQASQGNLKAVLRAIALSPRYLGP
ncbi:MAG TPA: hypothetical protein VEY30_12070 [Myxococcaceae bacterium]|nr:hypothetical protein [Myxococcaceae bacterium]